MTRPDAPEPRTDAPGPGADAPEPRTDAPGRGARRTPPGPARLRPRPAGAADPAAEPAAKRDPSGTAGEGSAPARPAGAGGRPVRRGAALLPPACYLLLSFFLYQRLWAAPGRRYLPDSMRDQDQWQWFFAVVADNLRHLRNPLFTHLQNAPDGVNLMANTGMPGLSVPAAPLTLLLGPSATWAVVLTLGLAGTAWAWYRLGRRHLGLSRTAAALAGGLCGFAPPVVSHGNAHPNLVVLFVVPFLVGRVLMLARGEGRTVRNGVVLGLLAAYQVLLGEEALLIAATGLALFLLGYAAARPSAAREAAGRLAGGLGTALAVCLPLAAFPLYWQFAGPQSYHDLPHGASGNDLRALVAFARRSLAGDAAVSGRLSANPTEENAFLGWPLVLLAGAVTVWLRREAAVRALAFTGAAAALLSLGPQITVAGHRTGIPGPWWLVGKLPLFESVLESRLTMVCFPVAAVLLARATDRVLAATRHPGADVPRTGSATGQPRQEAAPAAAAPAVPVRLLGLAALLMALVPLFPTPYPAVDRAPVPAFFTGDALRQHVRPGRAVVTVPLPSPAEATALHWQVASGLRFTLPEGYFVGPHGPDGTGGYGAVPRPTSALLDTVAATGRAPALGAAQRRQARADLAHWHADAVVLAPRPHDDVLRTVLDQLLGARGRHVGGVWVWDVR